MSNLSALLAARGSIEQRIAEISTALAQAKTTLGQQEAALAAATTDQQRQSLQSAIAQTKIIIANLEAELAGLYRELADIQLLIDQAQSQEGPRTSAGETVAQAQRANDQGADPIAPGKVPLPIGAAVTAGVITNADTFRFNQQIDQNTGQIAGDPPIKSLVSSQAIPQSIAVPGPIPGRIAPPNSPGQTVPVQSTRPQLMPQDTSGSDSGTSRVDGSGAITNEDATLNQPSILPGVGSRGDDSREAGPGQGVTAALNKLFAGKIEPTSNVLDQYASYTYSISIYLMNANDYRALISNDSLPKGAQLILQTGGAPPAGGVLPLIDIQEAQQAADGNGAPISQPDLGRNPNFPNDYYLDDIRITSVFPGKGNNMAHNTVKINFKVVEPNGITFLDNLYKATDQYVKLSGTPQVNYGAQNYLMVIRFYGYDKDGNLIQSQSLPGQYFNTKTNKTENRGVAVEKFIPFQFTAIKFRVANKLVEYDCEAVSIPNAVATSPARGTIPYNVELTSQSLKDLLTGQAGFAGGDPASLNKLSYAQITEGQDQGRTEKVPAGRSGTVEKPVQSLPGSSFDLEQGGTGAGEGIAAAVGVAPTVVTAGSSASQLQSPLTLNASGTKTLVTGLADALGRAQAEAKSKGAIEFEDRYFFDLDPLLATAKVVPPGSTNLRQTPMGDVENPRDKMLQTTQAVDKNARSFKILSGTSIVQFLDQVVRNTDYIYQQQTKFYDPKTKELKKKNTTGKVTGWYRISMQAIPQGADKYDRKRNDYAYDITYKVEVYAINNSKDDFFPPATDRGTHKRYNYWFTGANTEVLDLQQDFNFLYYIVQNAQAPVRTRTTNRREVQRYYFQPRSDQSDQMNEGPVSDPSAQLADYLYSPGDTAKVKMRILGDPAWIQQGDIRNGLIKGNQLYDAFLPDGTINFGGQEVLFEVLWNKPVDYDLSTGLMDPGTKNYGADRPAGKAGDAVQSHVYKTNICISNFNRGVFEQELEGSQIYFELPTAEQQEAEKQEKIAEAKTTDYRNPSVDIPSASPGMMGMELGEVGPINYNPNSLAGVLDSSPRIGPSILTPQTPRGAAPAAPATSATQTVGTANDAATTNVPPTPARPQIMAKEA